MARAAGLAVTNDRIRDHAERLAAGAVSLGALALAFSESAASTAEVHVEGRNFYPPMLEDIAAAGSSIHINQFGFRPGAIGDAVADALVAKAAEGVRVRLVVDRKGTDPEGSSSALYERLTAAGIEDHFQDGRFHDLFLRVEGPVVAQLQLVFLASFRWLGGSIPTDELEALFPELDAGAEPIPAVVLHNAPGRYRPISDAIGRLLDAARETLDVANPYVTDR